jgi:hypothetical protein
MRARRAAHELCTLYPGTVHWNVRRRTHGTRNAAPSRVRSAVASAAVTGPRAAAPSQQDLDRDHGGEGEDQPDGIHEAVDGMVAS